MQSLRSQFPVFGEQARGQPLRYLDNAATTLKPLAVIEAISDCQSRFNGPVHRGLYKLAEQASQHYEAARQRVARFINAPSSDNIVFTASATQSINLVALSWVQHNIGAGDQIYLTRLEHHSNYLPWQRLCWQRQARLKLIELNADGSLALDAAEGLFDPRTKLIALSHASNVTGLLLPVQQICARARAANIPTLVDSAQAVHHQAIDVQALGCDFLTFSGHKIFGPNGIGVLYVNPEHLGQMQPLMLGGGMVDSVGADFASTQFADPPASLEAGSQNLSGAHGLAAAIDFLETTRTKAGSEYLTNLVSAAKQQLRAIPGVELLPCPEDQAGSLFAFNLSGVHPHDVAQVAAESNLALRAGHHCAQPLMQSLGIAASVRASFSFYNDADDIEALVSAVHRAREEFA